VNYSRFEQLFKIRWNIAQQVLAAAAVVLHFLDVYLKSCEYCLQRQTESNIIDRPGVSQQTTEYLFNTVLPISEIYQQLLLPRYGPGHRPQLNPVAERLQAVQQRLKRIGWPHRIQTGVSHVMTLLLQVMAMIGRASSTHPTFSVKPLSGEVPAHREPETARAPVAETVSSQVDTLARPKQGREKLECKQGKHACFRVRGGCDQLPCYGIDPEDR